ncbi:MAG: FkbM family methyltransferase [Chitinophagaceae bacterium]|nr:MAG: FkbM family methyltransferase [Chitinophagaceae bacterium]
MIFKLLQRFIRRAPFPGQMRVFHYLFSRNRFRENYVMSFPLNGNFLLHTDTKKLIDARVVYTGDYEPGIKDVFKAIIKPGDTVLDIGANVGFHTLFFSELTGVQGRVFAFEPIPSNYQKLRANIALNEARNVRALSIALGNKNEVIEIFVDTTNDNPGSFNLFAKGELNTKIDCRRGDDVIASLELDRVDMMKVDVEGYEQFVLEGLQGMIGRYQPKIVFEFDKNYQLKHANDQFGVFHVLSPFGYRFFLIEDKGLLPFTYDEKLVSADILALPKRLFLSSDDPAESYQELHPNAG